MYILWEVLCTQNGIYGHLEIQKKTIWYRTKYQKKLSQNLNNEIEKLRIKSNIPPSKIERK